MATDDSTNSLRLNSVDRHGRHIDPAALAAAEAVSQRALELGTKLGVDSAVVANMLEEVAAEASLQLTWRAEVPEAAPIRNLSGYVFRAFGRDVNRLKRKEIALLDDDTPRYTLAQRWVDPSRQLEMKILSDECLAQFDFEVGDMCSRWMARYSWDEIGKIHGISGHAAELRFWNAVRRMRKQLAKRRESLLRTTRTDQNAELKPAMRTDGQKKTTSA
jgi:hypothetical protein